MYLKAEAARLECEGDGAPDVEAFFALQEGAKPPIILAAGAGLYKRRKRLALTYFPHSSTIHTNFKEALLCQLFFLVFSQAEQLRLETI
ncbi:hypothetical protein CN565_12470 [Bacillus pseudomycoides]|nr:hypothetical protein CON58_21195 [Bacillus pseudomycoides]PEP41313.1 hypothetical protein CN565_12470 [Bacillus pseudomycoides]PFX41259.1 hypothetical protein COL32_18870 [Bacillus pseudomycoides]PFZ84398.1 hypothetical protein COL69_06685 [Bacillus pseudomycoides]PGE20002.1 hypothetical protein COM51_08080 [Bacillus pseudomycoides]